MKFEYPGIDVVVFNDQDGSGSVISGGGDGGDL